MKKHRFDPFSFVFGLVFVALATAAALGGTDFDFEAWVLPASILFLGVGLLLVTIRALTGTPDDQ